MPKITALIRKIKVILVFYELGTCSEDSILEVIGTTHASYSLKGSQSLSTNLHLKNICFFHVFNLIHTYYELDTSPQSGNR